MIGVVALGLALTFGAPRGYDGPTAIEAPTESVPATATAAIPRPRTDHRAGGEHVRRRARPSARLHARWALDATITVGAAVPWLVLSTWVTKQLPLDPLPADPPELGKVDAVARGRFSPHAAIASNVLVATVMAAAPLLALIDGHWAATQVRSHPGRAFAHRWGTAVLIEAEAIALTGLVGSVMKAAVHRPRPYTTLAPEDVPAGDRDELQHELAAADRSHSFPSAHAALAFAAATSLATTLTLDAPRTRRARVALGVIWSVALVAAGTTAALRVVAGYHYPSDVVTGAAIGSAIGIATPLAHVRWRERRR